jgi:uncharacterized membrane protein (UPF0127 family)|tara:strand:- start:209 stop:619 length:411 start_codon:yes stop_codon:yes gene_type:complete
VKDTIRQIDISGYPFSIEVVETPEKRAKGLSGRSFVPNGTGMLFNMTGGPAQFHMRDTHVPLDILYLGAGGVILKKDRMHPHTGHSHCDEDVHSVLELPLGTCDELAVEVGDILDVDCSDTLRETIYEMLSRAQRI